METRDDGKYRVVAATRPLPGAGEFFPAWRLAWRHAYLRRPAPGRELSLYQPRPELLPDWSTGTEDGAEHLLTLHVWSRACGNKQVHDIIEAIKSTLHDQPLALVDHDLVNLRHEFSEARPDPDGDTYHGI